MQVVSRGTEAIVAANQALIKKDVISETKMTVTIRKPVEDGKSTHITEVICIDPAGSLP